MDPEGFVSLPAEVPQHTASHLKAQNNEYFGRLIAVLSVRSCPPTFVLKKVRHEAQQLPQRGTGRGSSDNLL